MDDRHELLAPIFGVLGAASAIVLSVFGAAYGTAKCMVGVAAVAPKKPQLIMKSLVPMIMAGVLGIYGLVCGVLIINNIDKPPRYSLAMGFNSLGAGISVGLSGMAAGYAIGNMGDMGIRASGLNMSLYTTVVLITGFAMVAGMYGLVVSLILVAKK